MAKLQIFLCVLLIAYGAQADSAARNRRSSVSSRVTHKKITAALAAATAAIAVANSTILSLESTVEKAYTEAKAAVDTIETEAESIRCSVTEKVSAIQTEINQEIADIESAGGTCDVSSCTSPLTSLQTTAETVVSKATSCVEAVEDEANKYLETIASCVESDVSTLNDYIAEIEKCVVHCSTVLQASVAIICIEAVEVKIAAAAVTVPAKLLEHIVETNAEIVTLKANLATCSCTNEITALSTSSETSCEQAEACVAEIVSSGCCT